jgi:sugar phosphate isomerase/epimerase
MRVRRDGARLTELFAQLCELGRHYGQTFHLELTPWTGLKTLAQASRIVAAADRTNGKVMVDTIHVDRVGNTAADIAALPARQIVYARLCDGPMPRRPTSIR